MKKMIFNKKSPLTVGIVSLLPKGHKLTMVNEITKTILGFSPLLRLTQDNAPDIVISFNEEEGKTKLRIARKDKEAHMSATLHEMPDKLYDMHLLQLHRSIYSCIIHDEHLYEAWAMEKWREKHRIEATSKVISYKVTNLVEDSLPEYVIAQGYQQALQSILKTSEVVDPQKLQIQVEANIKRSEQEPGNIDIQLVYSLPDNHYFIKEKEHIFLDIFKNGQQAPDQILEQTHTLELSTSNLLHENVQLVAPMIHSPLEWMRIFLFNYYSDWNDSLEEAKNYVVVSLSDNQQDEIDHVFILPENGSLPVRLHETVNSVHTNKLCQNEIAEVFHTNKNIIGSCVDIEIVYGKQDLSIEVKFNGQEMGNAKVPLEVLQATSQRQKIFQELKGKFNSDIILPLAMYALKPQASA